MGRKTYDSIGRPLPWRSTIVITRQPDYAPPGVIIAHSLDEALERACEAGEKEEIFVAGGEEIFRLALALGRGDRIQLTANSTDLGVSTRDIGTITKLDANGNIQVQLDKGRKVRWNLADHRHIDHAYAMTSYSAQGTTVDRVLLQIDTSDYRLSGLIDRTLAYVGASRAQYDIQIFADDASRLGRSLGRENERAKALSPEQIRAYRPEGKSIAYV